MRGFVDRLGDQLFAGPGLASDQHGRIVLRHRADLLVHLDHRRMLADQPERRVRTLDFGLGHLCRRAPSLRHQALNHALGLVEVQRLDQVVRRARAHGLDRAADVRMTGKDDHVGERGGLAKVLQELQAGHARHLHVRKDEIRTELLDSVEGSGRRVGRHDLVPEVREVHPQRLADRGLVFRDEQSGRTFCAVARFHGGSDDLTDDHVVNFRDTPRAVTVPKGFTPSKSIYHNGLSCT